MENNDIKNNILSELSTNKIRVVELFAGVGGFRLGFERSSSQFETVWANQWEPKANKQWAFDCYQKHFGIDNNKHINKDISTIIDEVPSHDLLVGGFPCQDYSVAHTNAKGIEGKKGVLWWSIIEIIKLNKPKLILLENVDRLLKSPSSQRGRDFAIMLKTLNDEGYNVEWRVINAADYGFAQRRKRIFIFCSIKTSSNFIYKDDIQENNLLNGFFSQEFPILSIDKNKSKTQFSFTDKYSDLVEISNNFSTTFYNSGLMIDGKILSIETVPEIKDGLTLNDIVEKNKVDSKYFLTNSKEKFIYLKNSKKIQRTKPNGEPYTYSEGTMTYPDSLQKPARTMLTSEGSVNRSTHVIIDPLTGELRLLTPLECERINGFDDNWTNTGMPHKFRYFCMGNALVVPVIEKIGKQITKIWKLINDGQS